MIEEPVAGFEILRSKFFDLPNRFEMYLDVYALPAVIPETGDTLNRYLLLLGAGIRESLCDRAFREVKRVGKTERNEVSGNTSKILNAIVENWFQFPRDIYGVPYCFHR